MLHPEGPDSSAPSFQIIAKSKMNELRSAAAMLPHAQAWLAHSEAPGSTLLLQAIGREILRFGSSLRSG